MIKSSKIAEASLKDRKRYEPNPLGDGYLTRGERWTQAYYYAKATETEPCAHEGITTPDGHGSYCKFCGITLA